MSQQMIIDKNVFNHQSEQFLNQDELSLLLFIISEKRLFNPIIEIHKDKLLDKGLLLNVTNRNELSLRKTVNRLNNKGLIEFIEVVSDYYRFSTIEFSESKRLSISAESYLNSLKQATDTSKIQTLIYVSAILKGEADTVKTFTYSQLSKATGKTVEECKRDIEWLAENGLLAIQENKQQNNSKKVYDLSYFREGGTN